MKSIQTTTIPALTLALALAALPVGAQQATSKVAAAGKAAVPVTVKNFQRAESDLYFSRNVKLGGFGKFYHYRTMTPIEEQSVVRMNRDALFDLANASSVLQVRRTGEPARPLRESYQTSPLCRTIDLCRRLAVSPPYRQS